MDLYNKFFFLLIVDQILVYVWYKHLFISSLLSLMRFLLIPYQNFTIITFDVVIILLTTFAFGFVERSLKERWVLMDSFKRAEKTYMKFADQVTVPAFVIDSMGKIMYSNKEARELYNSVEQNKNTRPNSNFLDLIHENARKNIEKDLKNAVKSKIDPIEMLLLDHEIKRKIKCDNKYQLGLDNDMIEQGIFLNRKNRIQLLQRGNGTNSLEIY